jgi:nitrilase
LRFPEYFRKLTEQGAEVMFLPSSFRKTTGQIAWDILPSARAIENQVYFCACNQTGDEGLKARCGNSKIISYNGEIIASMAEEEGHISADLDIDALRKYRKELPVGEASTSLHF